MKSFDALICVCFVLAHVLVPRVSELSELLPLDLLHINELLILALLHAPHLTSVLDLSKVANFDRAPFGFEVIYLSVALV